MLDIDVAIRNALKSKDAIGLAAYRALKTKVTVQLTAAGRGGGPLTEDEFHASLRREIKERMESNEYLDDTSDEFRTNRGIATILQAHLPQMLSPDEAEALIQQAIADCHAATPKDMGAVMKALRDSGKPVDMKSASARVKDLLQS